MISTSTSCNLIQQQFYVKSKGGKGLLTNSILSFYKKRKPGATLRALVSLRVFTYKRGCKGCSRLLRLRACPGNGGHTIRSTWPVPGRRRPRRSHRTGNGKS